ncbi:major facilitator superfamily domain-containing protein [Fusarium venenatum]|uniref:major facilitator superfamily domain-containing protein n=1 Tax=Fusarium venenatum TaxID=56646 RepID=UPI001E085A76|nr:major facilitator superfamily domain-containing protein [Fusarium venenatum]
MTSKTPIVLNRASATGKKDTNVSFKRALTRDIVATVDDSSDSIWYTQTIAIFTAILGIPISQAADLWGRKIFLVILTAFGFIGSLIIASANSPCLAITGFAVTGISYGTQPLLHAIASEIFARKYRPWGQCSVNVAASLGAIMGFFHEKFHRLDWPGYGLLTPALVLFCMSLAWIQNPYSWTDTHVSVTFIIGVCIVVCIFFSQDSLITGAHYSVAFAALGISAIISGLWCSKTKAMRVPTIVAFSFFVLFNGFGLGICLPSLVTVAHFATPQELIVIASGLTISLRSLGGSVGPALYGAVLHHGFSSILGSKIVNAVLPLGFPKKELPQLVSALASHNETMIKQIHGISPEIIEAGYEGLLEAYRIGFRGDWVTTASLSLVAGIDNFTAHIDAPMVVITEGEEEMDGSTYTLTRMS